MHTNMLKPNKLLMIDEKGNQMELEGTIEVDEINMKEKLKEKLLNYFNVNKDCDYYILTRDKSAFGYGTMSFDDFKKFDEEIIDDIVSYIFKDEEVKEITLNTEVERCIKSLGED